MSCSHWTLTAEESLYGASKMTAVFLFDVLSRKTLPLRVCRRLVADDANCRLKIWAKR